MTKSPCDGQPVNQSAKNLADGESPDAGFEEDQFVEQYHPQAHVFDIFGNTDPLRKMNNADQLEEVKEDEESQEISSPGPEDDSHRDAMVTNARESRLQDGVPLSDQPSDRKRYLGQRKRNSISEQV